MNQALAENIRTLRQQLSWTQEQLAEATQLNLRTIQRAEAAEGASAETVLAIAGALNVDVDLLRFDAMAFVAQHLGVPKEQLTPELLAKKRQEIAASHVTISLTRVANSGDLRFAADADGLYFDCTSTNDDVLDRAAELKQQLMDLMNIGDELDAEPRRELEKAAFRVVSQLHQARAVVSIALHAHKLKPSQGEAMPWSTLYVIVAPENEPKEFLLLERNTPVRLG